MTVQRLGDHELIEPLGRGSMGVVWKARDERSDRLVALKVMSDTAGGRRFRREFRAAQRLSHPNVVRVFEMGRGEIDGADRLWFTMELVPGESLRELVDRDAAGWPPERNSPEWLTERLAIAHQVALGLEHCHQHGVLHRDLKPTNVLVGEDGVVKVVDFGLARTAPQASSISGAGQLIGTVAYMSPEQARGARLDARSDVHSFGALLHELACARAAFRGDDLPSLLMQVLFQPAPDVRTANPGVDAELARLVADCLAKEPHERPRGMAEVAARLEAIAAAHDIRLAPGEIPAARGGLRVMAPHLAGRDAEKFRLREALERAAASPVVLRVSGPSGVGKSRLAAELRVDAELAGFHVLSCAAMTSPRPLGALRQALAAALEDPTLAAGRHARLLTGVLPELRSDSSQPAGAPHPADRLRVAWAAEELLRPMLERSRHVLLLDDLHRADALSAEVIENLIAHVSGPLLVVGIFRDDPQAEPRPAAVRLRAAFAEHPAAESVELHALDAQGLARLVESLVGCRPDERVTEQLLAATGGVPHDVEQVVRELAERGAARVRDGELELSMPADVDLASLSASEATRQHLATLGELPRRVALAVALTGQGVLVDTLTTALDVDSDDLLDAVDLLVQEGVLRDGPGPDEVSLAHDRMRRAIGTGSSSAELGSLRSALARALESAPGRADRVHRVAELDLAAGSLDEAARTVPRSAEAFAAAGLHALAVERYESLLALAAGRAIPGLATMRQRRAELLAQAGRTEDAVAAWAALAEDALPGGVAPWEARRQQAFLLMLLTRNREAAELLEHALDEAEAAGDPSARVRVRSVLGTVLDQLGDGERSRAFHEEAVSVARDCGTPGDLAMALNNLGVNAYRHGRLSEAVSVYGEAAPIFASLGDALHGANCRAGLAAVHLSRGEPDRSRAIAREALASMRSEVDVRGLSRVLEIVGLASLDLGDVSEAEACLDEALSIRERLREPWAQGDTLLKLAAVAAYRGDWSEADHALERAAARFDLAADAQRAALVAARRADLEWRRGAADSADRLARTALERAEEAGGTDAEREAILTLARLDADRGRHAEALERLIEPLSSWSEQDWTTQRADFVVESLACRALSGRQDDLEADAERTARRAAEGAPVRAGTDRLAAALAFDALGRADRAAELRSQALRSLERLAEALPRAERAGFARQHVNVRWLPPGEPERNGRTDDETSHTPEDGEMSREERDELAALRTFHGLVMAADPSEPDSLLEAFAREALARLDFRRALVFTSEGDELACRAALRADGSAVPPAKRRAPDQLLRRALERGAPELSLSVPDDPSIAQEGSVAELDVQAFAAVPVTTPDGHRLVAYLDGPPPGRDVRDALDELAPVLRDFGRLLDNARRTRRRVERADALLSSLAGGEGPIVGSSRAIEDLRKLIDTVAPTEASVLVLGENGTGKELVARELHERSSRSDGPLLARSCAELSETLLESELFGHVKGSFTGAARDRAGLFEAASGGTLFLDEVGEMTQSLQAKLLRVLETGEVTRIGESSTRRVDVRVVAATHRDLAAGVRDGSFRQDLYYRLKVIELRVPSLRDRPEDVSLLAHHFLAMLTTGREKAPTGFTHEALRALSKHDWPGNVRELRNVIERAIILAGERDEIGLDLLPDEVVGRAPVPSGADGPAVSGTNLREARDAFEAACIERALADNEGNRTHAARALGISVRSLQQKMSRHGVR